MNEDEVEMWYDRRRRLALAYPAPVRFFLWLGLLKIGRKNNDCHLTSAGIGDYIHPEGILWPFHVAPLWMWKAALRHPINWSRRTKVIGVFRNLPGVIKWLPGRVLPMRWGFHIMGLIEIGDRG